MTEHTPGPWDLERNEKGLVWIDSVLTGVAGICDLYHTDRGDNAHLKDNAIANAHLIAAAPDLLDVLSEYLVLGAGKCTISKVHAEKALAAIRKARGESDGS